MNYTFTKQYGKIVRKMAAEFNKGRDIFEAASALDKYAKPIGGIKKIIKRCSKSCAYR